MRIADDNGLQRETAARLTKLTRLTRLWAEGGWGDEGTGRGHDESYEERSGKREYIRRRKGAPPSKPPRLALFSKKTTTSLGRSSPPVSTLSSFMNMYVGPPCLDIWRSYVVPKARGYRLRDDRRFKAMNHTVLRRGAWDARRETNAAMNNGQIIRNEKQLRI